MAGDKLVPTARSSAAAALPRKLQQPALRDFTLSGSPFKTAAQPRSSDPYNSSGSFDRKQHWSSVGKR